MKRLCNFHRLLERGRGMRSLHTFGRHCGFLIDSRPGCIPACRQKVGRGGQGIYLPGQQDISRQACQLVYIIFQCWVTAGGWQCWKANALAPELNIFSSTYFHCRMRRDIPYAAATHTLSLSRSATPSHSHTQYCAKPICLAACGVCALQVCLSVCVSI